jgi:proteasome lid subunit RPN8/RPN11
MFSYNPNIYIGALPQAAVDAAVAHAKEQFPLESCGAIIAGAYVPFVNASENPENSFAITDPLWFELYMDGSIDCLVHSHNDYNMASLLDQQQQRELDLPSLIINLRQRSLMDCIVFGETVPAPLEGRPFFYGAFDCISLVGDYLVSVDRNPLPNPPHEWEFWARGERVFEDIIESDASLNLKEVPAKDFRDGDILLYNMFGTRYINHIAVVCGNNGEVLHHMYRHISGRYPINYCRQYLIKVMRAL